MNEKRKLASTLEKLIGSLVSLPDTLKKALEGTDSIVKQMPPHCTHKDKWIPSFIRGRSGTTRDGNVGILKRKLESSGKLQILLLLWDEDRGGWMRVINQ